MTENYALELLKAEQRKCSGMIKAKKELIDEGYSFHHYDLPKYEKQLKNLNSAIELLEQD